MKRTWVAAIVAGLGVVLGSPGIAAAAWHSGSAPRVVTGWTDSAAPGVAFPNDNRTHLPLGTWQDEAGVSHTSRVYATFDLSRYDGALVTGGTVYVTERTAADCTKRSIELWRTEPVPEPPAWDRAPAELAQLDEIQTPEYCPTARIGFDVGAAVAEASAAGQRLITFVLRVSAAHEADPAYGRRLNWYNDVALRLSYNTVPAVDSDNLFTTGRSCVKAAPYPAMGTAALQARLTDADEGEELTAEFAVWPVGSPDARRTYLDSTERESGRVATVTVPAADLAQNQAYGWQARALDGTETSAWSDTCYFTWDGVKPSAPVVTSTNFPAGDAPGPAGVKPVFVLDGHGDPDIAGFQYDWYDWDTTWPCLREIKPGRYGQWECTDPLDAPDRVRADRPGGTATVAVNPDSYRSMSLFVRSVDLAGNVSAPARYDLNVPWSMPDVTAESGTPEWNRPVQLTITPAPGVTATRYEVVRGQNAAETVVPDADGVAHYSLVATEVNGEYVTIRGIGADGFVSMAATWSYAFTPEPGIRADVYDNTVWPPGGGVGVPGTFTFSPPPGWTEVAEYRYSFDWESEPAVVPAGADGRATVTWTPEAEGRYRLMVYAVKADGTWSEYGAFYNFEVPADAG
ncbi:hypothetical protein [Catenuloplanes atrovinosus]|uniref:Uncharacterized protein n=1 Tax=Catenuloplanes atrovinosus TaxID=137266 RepID=A0AAE4CBZ1_9ACTN|nr:hypothetical protein [Catenuloplanes atrovinosus]MDR7278607.1 hypothetical protein [Catenuloplanes atrovinosus]